MGNNLLIAVDIAAVDPADGVPVQLKAPADLVKFFLIHAVFSFLYTAFLRSRQCLRIPVYPRASGGAS